MYRVGDRAHSSLPRKVIYDRVGGSVSIYDFISLSEFYFIEILSPKARLENADPNSKLKRCTGSDKFGAHHRFRVHASICSDK